MLKVNRLVVPVPMGLRKHRIAEFKEAIHQHFQLPREARWRRRAPYNASVIDGDPDLRAALYTVFNDKCAYCESPLENQVAEVAHLRPVSNAASSHKERDSPDHYAWLAYEWRNLILLCPNCNRVKQNLFPVAGPRALPLTTWNEAVNAEEALLLDPCVDEPRRHLRMARDGSLIPCSHRGAVTIELLDLNRLELQKERSYLLGHMLSVPRAEMRRAAEEFLDVRGPHAGALRLFVIGFGRVVAKLRGVPVPIHYKDLSRTLLLLRDMLSDSEWRRASDMVGDETGPDEFAIQSVDEAVAYTVRKQSRKQPRLKSIHIRNFKGIDNIRLELARDVQRKASGAPCAMLLGENSVGKSSILQAVALALMERRDRTALRLTAEDFLSRDQGSWQLGGQALPRVVLRFEGGATATLDYDESVDQFDVHSDTPCVILAYGSRRFFVEQGGRRKGAGLNKTLFDPIATLQDPGIWLRTIDEHTFDAVARAMREVLALSPDDSILRNDDGNVLVRAHGRVTPVERMSDGYRSLFAMAIDIMRQMLQTWDNLEFARGIVLIDEIETHLHPRWKMQVMSALRQAMPEVQFIATTHDPLCLRGMRNGEVQVLYRDDRGHVRLVDELPDIETLRAEQILTSDYFGLWTTADVRQEAVLMRLAALGARADGELNGEERRDRDALLRQFEGMPVIGSSPDRQILAEAMTRHLRDLPSIPLGERAALREDAIDQIVGVLERAMRT